MSIAEEWWRTGTSSGTHGLTIYRHTAGGPARGELAGMMLDPKNAALVVEAVNRFLSGKGSEDGKGLSDISDQRDPAHRGLELMTEVETGAEQQRRT